MQFHQFFCLDFFNFSGPLCKYRDGFSLTSSISKTAATSTATSIAAVTATTVAAATIAWQKKIF